LAFEYNNTISKICCHDEIVLDNEGSLLRVKDESAHLSAPEGQLLIGDPPFDYLASNDTLLGVEETDQIKSEKKKDGKWYYI
jgi:hypothetical protein